jgi:predicted RNase H-like HicB family nuclease
MTYFSFQIIIEKEPEDPGYFAHCPTLPGCFSNGLTLEEAKRNMMDAINLHVESLRAHNTSVPQNERIIHIEQLTVGIPE